MTARLPARRKVVVRPDAFTEIVLWDVLKPVRGSRHRFKYRLALVVNSVCVLRYDNEAGKGDHRHWGAQESAYAFTRPETLLRDFEADVRRWLDDDGRS